MIWKKLKMTTTPPLNHGRSRIFSQNYEWLKYKHTSEKIKNENQSTSLSPWCFDKNVWKHEVNYHPMHVRKIIFFHRCKWQLFSFFKFYNVFRIVRFFSSLCIFDKKYAFFLWPVCYILEKYILRHSYYILRKIKNDNLIFFPRSYFW